MMLNNFLNNDSNLESKDTKHKQKLTKGGFKMKPTRFLIVAIVLMSMVATASAMTAANTVISNRATGTYQDALSNTYSATSNWIYTTVAQLPGLSFVGGSETQAQNIAAFGSTTYAITIKNTGNGPDTYNLGVPAGTAGSFLTYIASDIAGTVLSPAVSPELAMNAEYTFYLVVTDDSENGAAESAQYVANLTVTSAFNEANDQTAGITQTGTYTSTVQAAVVNVASSSFENASQTAPVPGDLMTMDLCFSNTGSLDAHNVSYSVTLPSSVTFVSGSIYSDGNQQDDNATVEPLEDENGNITGSVVTITIPTISAGATSVCLSFQVTVNENLTPGSPITLNPTVGYDDGNDPVGTYPVTNPPLASLPTTQTWGVALAHTGTIAYTGLPTTTWEYKFTVTNNGSHSEDFALGNQSVGPDDSMVWSFYLDDGTGNITGSALTSTGSIARANSLALIAVGTITSATADGSVTVTTFKAQSTTDTADPKASGTDTGTTTVTAPEIMLVKSSVQGNGNATTEDGTIIEVAPGGDITYTLLVQNWGSAIASSVVITDEIPSNTTFKAFGTTTGTTAVYDASDDANALTVPNVTFTFENSIAAAADAQTPTQHTLSFTVTVN